jgi:hypothetical protein
LCIDENRDDIYGLMECIGYCSRFGRRGVVQYRSLRGELRGEALTRIECRKAARGLFPQEFSSSIAETLSIRAGCTVCIKVPALLCLFDEADWP